MEDSKKLCLFRILFTALILLATSLLIIVFDADRTIARLLVGPDYKWPGNSQPFWMFLYEVAPIPGLLLAIVSLVLFCSGFCFRSLRKFRRQTAFIVLLACLAPGLLVNEIGKNHMGRARPRELTEFGGSYQFDQLGTIGVSGKNSSFPSGHASMAFFLMAPWFIYRKKQRMVAQGFLYIGLAYGTLVGLGRILQGAHFLSDILWAGGCIFITGELLSCAFDFVLRPQIHSCSFPHADKSLHAARYNFSGVFLKKYTIRKIESLKRYCTFLIL